MGEVFFGTADYVHTSNSLGGGGNQKIFANLDVLQLLNSNQYNSGDQPYSDHSPYSGYSLLITVEQYHLELNLLFISINYL